MTIDRSIEDEFKDIDAKLVNFLHAIRHTLAELPEDRNRSFAIVKVDEAIMWLRASTQPLATAADLLPTTLAYVHGVNGDPTRFYNPVTDRMEDRTQSPPAPEQATEVPKGE